LAAVALIAGAIAVAATGGAGVMFFGAKFLTISTGAMAAMGLALASTFLMPMPSIPKSQLGRLNVSLDTNAPRKAVFGTTAMPLDMRYHEAGGTDQEYIDYIICVAAHKVQSIDEIYFEEKKAWDSSTGVTATYSGYLTVQTRLEGTDANYISINSGNRWGSDDRLTGCAYVYFRIKRSGNTKKTESPLVQGLPSRVTIIGEGVPLYDPRLDSTVTGGSGSHRADDQDTWGLSYSPADSYDNPALHLLFMLLGWKINGKLSIGAGVPPARIDMESFITAANICDEDVTLSIGGTQKRYRTSGTFSDADDRMDVMNTLLACMNGTLRDNGGKLSLDIIKNDLADPILDFTDDDVLSEFEWDQTGGGLSQNHNIARGRYVDPSLQGLYQMTEYPNISITSPDGIERVMSLDFPFVEDGRRAQRLAKQILQRNQFRGQLTAEFTAKAMGCDVGDIVTITLSALGFNDKLFRVISKEISPDGRVPLTLLEENALIYQWDNEDSAPVVPVTPVIYDPLLNMITQGDEAVQAIAEQAIADAAGAQSTADGKIESFYQDTMPSGSLGDFWIDTDDGNKLYRHDGTTFVEVQDDAIATAIADAAGAQATADGKIVTFYQDNAPTAEGVGDLWVDTNDSNKLYRWNGSAWQSARDTGIEAAIASAATAQATADGKIESFYQSSMPSGSLGDFWIDTDDGNKLYRHNGTTFIEVQDDAIATAISDAAGAQATADGKITTFYQTSAPTAEGVGDLWVDTDDSNKLYRWDGSSWQSARDAGITQALSDAAAAQSTADGKIESFYQSTMPSGSLGDFWIDTDDGNKLYRHNGITFIEVQDDAIATAISDAAGAQATADGKVTTFYATSAPTAEGVGDLWYDTDDKVLYRWDGSSWSNSVSDITQANQITFSEVDPYYIQADSTGTTTTSLPVTRAIKVFKGGTQQTSGVTVGTLGLTSGITATASVSSGLVTVSLSVADAVGYITVPITFESQTYDRLIVVNRALAAPIVGGSSGSSSFTDQTWTNISTTTYTQVTDSGAIVQSDSSGELKFTANASYEGSSVATIQAQYSTDGSSWTAAATATGSTPINIPGEEMSGFISISPTTVTGLTASTDYYVRLVAKRTTGSGTISWGLPTFTAQQP